MGKSCAARVGAQVQIHSKGTVCCPATTAPLPPLLSSKGLIALPWLSCHCPPLHLSRQASAAFPAPSTRDGKGRGLTGSRRRLQGKPCSGAMACKAHRRPRTACRHCLLPPPALAAAAAAPLLTAPRLIAPLPGCLQVEFSHKGYQHGVEPVHTEEEGRIICDLLAGEPERALGKPVAGLSCCAAYPLPPALWLSSSNCACTAATALAQLACC